MANLEKTLAQMTDILESYKNIIKSQQKKLDEFEKRLSKVEKESHSNYIKGAKFGSIDN